MKHCPNCNSEIPDEAKFCPNCGSIQPDYAQNQGGAQYPGDAPYPGPDPYGCPPPRPPRFNSYSVLSIVGFVLSFLMPFVGLIVSIIAYNDAKEICDFRSQGLAKAGIIVSIIIMVSYVLIFVMCFLLLIVANFVVSYDALPVFSIL